MSTEEPRAPDVIVPDPNVPPADVAARARAEKQKAKPPNPTDRIEARADRHIDELQADKRRLQDELHDLRTRVIPDLQAEVRWLDSVVAWHVKVSERTETAYGSAITFYWLSFVLVTIGGAVISYAAFIGPPQGTVQKRLADVGFASLVFGMILQAVNGWRGKNVLGRSENPPAKPTETPRQPNTSHPAG